MQVMGDYVVQQIGVSEQRATEIAAQQARLVLADYSREATTEAAARINKLDERVVELLSAEGRLDALQDPAYQIVLKKAQIGAASTDREGDYDLLARLLGQRASQESRYVRASVDRAVQVVDMIDDTALQGLTMLWIVTVITPGGSTLSQGVGQLEELVQRFQYENLPLGRRWLDHLDMIDLVRVTPRGLTTLKKFVPFFAEKWPGFLSIGIDGAAAAEIKVQSLQRGITALRVTEHDLKPGHYRLPYHSLDQLRTIMKVKQVSGEDLEFVVDLARDQGNLEVRDESLMPQFEAAITASPILSKVRNWWDQIIDYPVPTSAGITIAYANSRRYHQFENTKGLTEYLEQST
jgi:hypothetical protein